MEKIPDQKDQKKKFPIKEWEKAKKRRKIEKKRKEK